MSEKPTGLALLRAPFPAHQISKLPKPTKKQTEEVKANYRAGVRCQVCGTWHHPDVIHLDYVGHAALTDRLLDTDPNWTWEPVGVDSNGLPALDKDGGLWIKLTVCGVTRLGYGDAQGKTGGDAMKERIGDALRNAAMRFGAALDLWHKGDLHVEEQEAEPAVPALNFKSVPKEVYAKLPDDVKTQLTDIAMEVTALTIKGAFDDAYDYIEEQQLDSEMKTGLWALLDSKQRSGLKAVGENRRKAA